MWVLHSIRGSVIKVIQAGQMGGHVRVDSLTKGNPLSPFQNKVATGSKNQSQELGFIFRLFYNQFSICTVAANRENDTGFCNGLVMSLADCIN